MRDPVAHDPLLTSVPTLRGHPWLDPYILVRRLGKGAMGAVYLAWHLHLHVFHAVKIQLSRDRDAAQRFEREARLTARLQHEHLVRVFDVREAQDGLLYMAMEFVCGETLFARVARVRALPLPVAAALVRRVARGLDVAHRAGIVHRDIKPANVLVGREGEVKLADLGIAHGGADPLQQWGGTLKHALLGTPGFMAPEQYQGAAQVGPAADVFALAATFAFLLTGGSVLEADGQRLMDCARSAAAFPDLRGQCPTLPASVAGFLLAAGHRDPRVRIQDAAQFLSQLDQVTPADLPASALVDAAGRGPDAGELRALAPDTQELTDLLTERTARLQGEPRTIRQQPDPTQPLAAGAPTRPLPHRGRWPLAVAAVLVALALGAAALLWPWTLTVASEGRVAAQPNQRVTVHAKATGQGLLTPHWSWQILTGPAVELQGADTATISFVAPATDLRLRCAATILGQTATNEVEVVVAPPASRSDAPAPLAEPALLVRGPTQADAGDLVTLTVTATGSDRRPMPFTVTQLGGPRVQLPPATPELQFTAPMVIAAAVIELRFAAGDLEARHQLAVTPRKERAEPTLRTEPEASNTEAPPRIVPASRPKAVPRLDVTVASELALNERETRDITASVPEPEGASFAWTVPADAPLRVQGVDTATLRIRALELRADAETEITLNVTAPGYQDCVRTLRCVVHAKDDLPVLEPLPPREVTAGQEIAITARAQDPEQAPCSWRWRQRTGPPGTIRGEDTATVRVLAPDVDQDTTLELVVAVSDGGQPVEQPVRILVRPAPRRGVWVTVDPAFDDIRLRTRVREVVVRELGLAEQQLVDSPQRAAVEILLMVRRKPGTLAIGQATARTVLRQAELVLRLGRGGQPAEDLVLPLTAASSLAVNDETALRGYARRLAEQLLHGAQNARNWEDVRTAVQRALGPVR